MSSVQEIRTAIEKLDAREKALLTAELFALNPEPDATALEAALQRGLADVEAGRVFEGDEVREMIPRWTTGS